MSTPYLHLPLTLAVTLAAAASADQIVQEGSLDGWAGSPIAFDIHLEPFDTEGGTRRLDAVRIDLLTGLIGGGSTNGEGGPPTRLHVRLDADYALGDLALAETSAEVRLLVHHDGPPVSFSFFDSDHAHVVLASEDDLATWIGDDEVVMTAVVELMFDENPEGSTSASAGGSVDYTVTYDFTVLGTTTTTEDYEDLVNDDGWSWGTGNETIVPLNGHPAAHLEDASLYTHLPILAAAPGTGSEFVGDFRARGVVSVGVDLIVKDADFPVGNRPLTLFLINDRGTPDDYDDDLLVWYVGEKDVPQAAEPGALGTPPGWTDFDFDVPSSSTSIPEGWEVWSPDAMTADEIWNAVVTDVDSVEFWYGRPGVYYLMNSWTVGADNVRITGTAESPILGDLNGDGAVDQEDLTILVRQFGPCSGCAADLDGDGVVDVDDLLILMRIMNDHFPLLGAG